MKLLRTFPILAFALVLLSIASFCAAKGFVGFLILTGAIAALSWYVCEGPRGLALPKVAANILILVASIGVLPDIIAHPNDMIGVLGRFAVWLSLIKLYERKSPRDYAQLLWLSLILMVAGTLETTEFLFAIALLCYSALGFYVLLLFQLYQSYINSYQDRYQSDPGEQKLTPSLRPVLGRTVKGQFITTAAILGVVGLLLSIVIFLAYPRSLGLGMFSRLTQIPIKNKTGFVNEISLTNSIGQRITDSKSPVLRVKLTNKEGIPVEYAELLYLRGAALDFYDPEFASWKKAPTPMVTMYRGISGPEDFSTVTDLSSLENDQSRRTFTLEVTPLIPLEATVFSLYAPVSLSTESEQQFLFDQTSLAITLPDASKLETYRIRSDPLPSKDMLKLLHQGYIRELGPRRRYSNPRIKNHTIRLLRDADLGEIAPGIYPARGSYNRKAAQTIEHYLHQNFLYTLDLEGVELEGDPIEQFIFSLKKGHCEFFASAMTAMCQSLGIEARLVTGFLGAEYLGDGEYTIRESNAHAWVEVRTSEFGWSRFDPTPPSAIAEYHLPENTLADRVRNIYELLEVGWIQNFVNYDDTSQAELKKTFNFESFAWLDTAVTGIKDGLKRFINRFGAAGALQIATIVAAVIVAILIIIRLIRRLRRTRKLLHLEHLRGSEYRTLQRQLGFYLDMLDMLKRAGLSKPMWQPPLAFAQALEDDRPEIVSHVKSITEIFYSVRYGGQSMTQTHSENAKSALQNLAETLAVKV